MTRENIIGGVLMSCTVLYGVFHVGRWYEWREARGVIAGMPTVFTEYRIPDSDPRYGGEVAEGNCTPNNEFENVLEYAGVEY